LPVLVVSGVVRLARRDPARRLVLAAEGVTGVGDLTLRRSLRVAVESGDLEVALAASGSAMGDGSGKTGRGRGIGVHRRQEESRRLRERREVTEIVRRRGTDGRYLCLVRVHHRVDGGNFCGRVLFWN